MRASKETCTAAQDDLGDINRWAKKINSQRGIGFHVPPSILGNMERIGRFLNVAKRKLPTEAAYEKDAKRRRQ